jgi:MoxR-like ATPase
MDDKWLIYRHYEEGEDRPRGWDITTPKWREMGELPENVTVDGAVRHFQPVDPVDAKMSRYFHYRADPAVIDTVNLALRLRRPILVTGVPGTGKTSLATSIAHELGLGPVLEWLITSRSTVRDGLYQYDALGRVSDMTLAEKAGRDAKALQTAARDIGRYVTLGPLGDALLPRAKPRVLLIDEIDKCDMDLPGDLLHVLDRGSFEIPELVREAEKDIKVRRAGAETEEESTVWVHNGRVRCHEFPIVVITSNEDRDFSAAFQRRCLPIRLQPPGVDDLKQITAEKLYHALGDEGIKLIEQFADPDNQKIGRGRDARKRAISQLLNALYVRVDVGNLPPGKFDELCNILFASLD